MRRPVSIVRRKLISLYDSRDDLWKFTVKSQKSSYLLDSDSVFHNLGLL